MLALEQQLAAVTREREASHAANAALRGQLLAQRGDGSGGNSAHGAAARRAQDQEPTATVSQERASLLSRAARHSDHDPSLRI